MIRSMLAVLTAVGMIACAHLSSQDRSDLAEYTAQQNACIAAHHGDAPAIDRCRADVKARWDKAWSGRFDGGVR